MKVCIVTIYDKNNLGNRLQNYAVQEILKSLGCTVCTIVIASRQKRLKHLCQVLHDSISFDVMKRHRAIRQKKIMKFNKDFIKTLVIENITKMSDIASRFDYFVVGSDQVWNTLWYFSNEDKLYLLDFADPCKRIALSASFGIDYIPEKWKQRFYNELIKFRAISVREYSGYHIVNDLTNREVCVLIDPVLYLDDTFWRKLSVQPLRRRLDKKKYIFCYFIDSQDSSMDLKITSYVKRHDLEIINVKGLSNKFYCISPLEFLWLIDNASLVCTDSYHAYVFSFLFHVPAVYVDSCSIDMSSRVNSFVKLMGLNKNNIEDMCNDNIKLPMPRHYSLLKNERKKFFEYIVSSLEKE